MLNNYTTTIKKKAYEEEYGPATVGLPGLNFIITISRFMIA